MFRHHYGDLSATVMGMSLAIAEVNCAAQFAVANITIVSAALLLKFPNCGDGHSANDKICPRYKRETEILKLKTEAKLSYTDACKAHRIARSPPVPNMVSQSAFPPLPKKTVGVDRTQARSIVGAVPFPHAAGVPPDQDEMVITEQLDFSSLLFGNPVTFLVFLAEIIRQTMLAKDNNESIDVCQIITKAAGDRMGLPVDAGQITASF